MDRFMWSKYDSCSTFAHEAFANATSSPPDRKCDSGIINLLSTSSTRNSSRSPLQTCSLRKMTGERHLHEMLLPFIVRYRMSSSPTDRSNVVAVHTTRDSVDVTWNASSAAVHDVSKQTGRKSGFGSSPMPKPTTTPHLLKFARPLNSKWMKLRWKALRDTKGIMIDYNCQPFSLHCWVHWKWMFRYFFADLDKFLSVHI